MDAAMTNTEKIKLSVACSPDLISLVQVLVWWAYLIWVASLGFWETVEGGGGVIFIGVTHRGGWEGK